MDSKRVAKDVIQMESEKLDRDIGRAVQLGERAVKKPAVQHSWSRQLRKAAYTHQYWKRRIRLHPFNIINDEVMEELREIAVLSLDEINTPSTLDQLKEKGKTSECMLRMTQKQSVPIRRK